MYCWGASEYGQLGFKTGDGDRVMSLPTSNCFFEDRPKLRAVSCGSHHTVFVLEDGTLYSCGANEHFQLGHDKSRDSPEQISSLELIHITQAACGEAHTLAVSNKGQVYSWGQNSQGQCGRGSSNFEPHSVPRPIKHLSSYIVVQVSCGNRHSLALTNVGHIFSWGDNSHGQLGIGEGVGGAQSQACLLHSLLSLPIKQVAGGGFHSFALTLSGALFGWGKNREGQLGVNDKEDKKFPVQVKSLRTQLVVHVACGEDHTAVLTKDGGVFTFGSGSEGQLGHSTTNYEPNPRKVFELMGSQVTQLSCGKSHTMAYVSKADRIYAFGGGDGSQLGIGTLTSKTSPVAVHSTWQQATGGSASKNSKSNYSQLTVKSLYSGYNSCFLVLNKAKESIPPDDFRDPDIHGEILRLTKDNSSYLFNNAKLTEDAERKKHLETIFSHSSCLNASFLKSDDSHFGTSSKEHGVNLDDARKSFEKINGNHDLLSLIASALSNLIPTLSNSPPDVEALRLYLILYECPVLGDMKSLSLVILPLGLKLIELSQGGSRVLDKWWSKLQPRFFSKIVVIYKDSLLILIRNKADDKPLLIALKVLEKLNNVNQTNEIIPYFNFYMPEINELINLKTHYFNWLKNRKEKSNLFSFCDYPFIMDAHAKTSLLIIDAGMQMQNAVNEAYRQTLQTYFGLTPDFDPTAPVLVLQVDRTNLLTTTLQQLVGQKSSDFKKPLKVIFVGEEAIDDGGVKKEFFMLIMKEILDPKYGMFEYHEDSRLIWFNPDSFESGDLYKLVGCLCGLAIYNNVIIDLPFPSALFKKLLRRPLALEDFKLLQPTVGRSLQVLVDYEESDVESVFHLNFTVTRDVWGKLEVLELVPGGADIAVTAQNKEKYVESYVEYVLVSSVAPLYQAFDQGFHSVCGGDIIELFQPQELQMMVIGHQNYDWDEFKQCCEYKGEYFANHPTIRFFWEVFHEMPYNQKQKFLVFLTGSDRIPILGLKTLKISIQPVRGGEEFLPVAHTCFNLLDLPVYSTKDKLKEKLYKAIENSQGFALI